MQFEVDGGGGGQHFEEGGAPGFRISRRPASLAGVAGGEEDWETAAVALGEFPDGGAAAEEVEPQLDQIALAGGDGSCEDGRGAGRADHQWSGFVQGLGEIVHLGGSTLPGGWAGDKGGMADGSSKRDDYAAICGGLPRISSGQGRGGFLLSCVTEWT